MPSIDHLQQFRVSHAVKEFNSKWQFPVYFQLRYLSIHNMVSTNIMAITIGNSTFRFHAIATELESALEDLTAPCSTTDFKLDATRVMIKVLNQVI